MGYGTAMAQGMQSHLTANQSNRGGSGPVYGPSYGMPPSAPGYGLRLKDPELESERFQDKQRMLNEQEQQRYDASVEKERQEALDQQARDWEFGVQQGVNGNFQSMIDYANKYGDPNMNISSIEQVQGGFQIFDQDNMPLFNAPLKDAREVYTKWFGIIKPRGAEVNVQGPRAEKWTPFGSKEGGYGLLDENSGRTRAGLPGIGYDPDSGGSRNSLGMKKDDANKIAVHELEQRYIERWRELHPTGDASSFLVEDPLAPGSQKINFDRILADLPPEEQQNYHRDIKHMEKAAAKGVDILPRNLANTVYDGYRRTMDTVPSHDRGYGLVPAGTGKGGSPAGGEFARVQVNDNSVASIAKQIRNLGSDEGVSRLQAIKAQNPELGTAVERYLGTGDNPVIMDAQGNDATQSANAPQKGGGLLSQQGGQGRSGAERQDKILDKRNPEHKQIMLGILEEAGGDPEKAQQIATQRGYSFI